MKHIEILLKTAHISIADLDNLDTRDRVGHEINQTIGQTPNKDAIKRIGDYAKEWGLYGFLDSRSEMKYMEVKNGVSLNKGLTFLLFYVIIAIRRLGNRCILYL